MRLKLDIEMTHGRVIPCDKPHAGGGDLATTDDVT